MSDKEPSRAEIFAAANQFSAEANARIMRANHLASLSPEGQLMLEWLDELRAIRRVLERWDAQGVPSTRNDGL